MTTKRKAAANFSHPSSSAAVVFGGHLSARAAFRLDQLYDLTAEEIAIIENGKK